ncbi:hypothetical protein RB195_007767 [Necator americanus]|uniref:Hydrolase, alpha/beta domain protein n=1 Tax=Necator americanus TaxID=51031 RepID=A0ABR1C293_NECAM
MASSSQRFLLLERNFCDLRRRFYSGKALELASIRYGDPSKDRERPPLIICHGLFGQKQNWHSVSKAMQRRLGCTIYSLDLRNHGESPWSDSMNYDDMSADVVGFLENLSKEINFRQFHLLGHSMGGRVAMRIAVEASWQRLIDRLIIEDVSPKAYEKEFAAHVTFRKYIHAMAAMDLSKSRREILKELEDIVPDIGGALLDIFLVELMTDCAVGEQKLLSELRVTELKQELEKRNLDKNGIKIILTDRLEKALIADGHDPATYLFRVNENMASPGSVKPSSPAISPAASMEDLTDGSGEKKEATSENGNGVGTGESQEEPMESDNVQATKDGNAENPNNADNLDNSKDLIIAEEPAGDPVGHVNEEEMLEDPLVDVPTEGNTAPAKSAVTVTAPTSTVKTPVQAPVNDDKEKDIASRSIWVRGLTSATKAADLKVLCTQFGKVVRAKIYTSKKQTTSACYGYVTMADSAAAEKAAAALHKTQIKGRTISVEKADRSKVPAVKTAGATAALARKDAPSDSAAAKRESEKKTNHDASKSTKTSVAAEKSQSESKGGKNTSTTQSKRDDARSDRKRDDKDTRRLSNSERRDSERPFKLSDSKREPYRRAPARDPRRDSQRTITAARRFPASTRGVPTRGLRGRITRPGDRANSYLSIRRPEAMSQRDLLTLMRRKEEEHRRREAEIEKERALERERERIRFEREQLEKERLQLQLQAALQQQKMATMNSSRTKSTYLPTSGHASSRGRHEYRDNRSSRGDKVSSTVHRRTSGDTRRPSTTDDRSRSRHVGGGDRSSSSRIERDRSDHKPAPSSTRERGRGHESYGSSRGHSSSQPAAYSSRKEYDRVYPSSRDSASYTGRGGSSYYGSSGAWASSSSGYGSSSWQGGSGSAVGHSSSGSAWAGRGGTGSNGWSTFGSGAGTSSSSSLRYDYDKYQQRF